MIIQHGLAKAGYTVPGSAGASGGTQTATASSEHKLSSKAADFLAKLRSDRSDFDFIVADAGDDHQALVKQSNKEFTVVYTSAELERMASDPKFAAEKDRAIETTLSMTKKICEQNGYVRTFGKNGGEGTDAAARARVDEFWASHDMLYAQQTAAALEKINDGKQTALEIYRRMARGATVSPIDEQNLMSFDPNMYQAAKMSQLMAKKHEDMSDRSLIEEFEKRHENDRRDWTSELDEKIAELNESAEVGGRLDAEA